MRHRFITGAALTADLLAGAAAFTPGKTAVSAADQQFVNAAAVSGQFEVAAGKLAAQSTNPRVQAFGPPMVEDHSAADAQFARLVKAQGGTLPAGSMPSIPGFATISPASRAWNSTANTSS